MNLGGVDWFKCGLVEGVICLADVSKSNNHGCKKVLYVFRYVKDFIFLHVVISTYNVIMISTNTVVEATSVN